MSFSDSLQMAGSPTPSLPALSPASSINQSPEETGQMVCQATTFTHKQWVVPPRPKPGRKPATDVPPTKRKAQNRAAQRAFRERRAAKVEEMEDRMTEKESERLQERNDLLAQIGRLEAEVERFRGEVLAWQTQSQELEQGIRQERLWRENAEREMLQRRKSLDPQGYERLVQSQQAPARGQVTEGAMDRYDTKEEVSSLLGCDKCTNTRCECLEEAMNMSTDGFLPGDIDVTSKQSSSANGIGSGSQDAQARNDRYTDSSSLETDYTQLFASTAAKGTVSPTQPSQARAIPADPCGFCQDGAPCICAQMESSRPAEVASNTRPSNVLSRFTPPPADGDVCKLAEPRTTPRQTNSQNNPCAGGPGTCAQCQVDPNSTIFCKSLAATKQQPLTTTTAPARGSSGCCKSKSGSGAGPCRGLNAESIPQPSLPHASSLLHPPSSSSSTSALVPARKEGTAYLSCADTYITLSRHPHYHRATDELDTWLGKLKTTLPTNEAGRPAIEIEAASVMGVLKFFDRRFGRE